jgi:hypothetical protein
MRGKCVNRCGVVGVLLKKDEDAMRMKIRMKKIAAR